MRKLIPLMTLCLVLMTSVASAQLDVQVRQLKGLVGLGDVTMVDGIAFVEGDPDITLKNVTALRVTPGADIEVETEDRKIVIIEESESTPGLYLFKDPGKYYVVTRLIDWKKEKQYKDRRWVTVKGGLRPIPKDARYPQTLKNIGKLVTAMSKEERYLSAQTLRDAAESLQRSKFIQQSQVAQFIRQSRPQTPAVNALFKQLAVEARREGSMGLQTVAEYYLEISRYIDVDPPKREQSFSVLKTQSRPVGYLPQDVTPLATQPTPLPPALRN